LGLKLTIQTDLVLQLPVVLIEPSWD